MNAPLSLQFNRKISKKMQYFLQLSRVKTKVIYAVYIIAIFARSVSFGQQLSKPLESAAATSNNYKVNWKVNPFDQQTFITNRGQFDTLLKSTAKVLYGAELGDVKAFFTADGFTYYYNERLARNADDKNEKDEQEAHRKYKTHYLTLVWQGANPNVVIEASLKRSDYYVYPNGQRSSIQADLFKKITYRNLYPGIDVEYIFPEGKQGLKYAVIVHPGADISKIKLKYIGANSIKKNKKGDVVINTTMGDFIDHAPVSYYNSGAGIQSAFALNENTVSFFLNKSESLNLPHQPGLKSETITIDPWITNPFGGTGDGWDLDYDYNGNVYSGSSIGLVKLNSAGVLQWTYKTNIYEDFTVDRITGNSFIVGIGGTNGTSGAVEKISTTGSLIGTFSSLTVGAGTVREFWRCVWNPCTDQIIIGGGGTGGAANVYQGAIINTNLTGFNIYNVVGASFSSHDMVGVAVDPAGSSCYMACCFRIPEEPLVKLPLPALTPTLFNVDDGYFFSEQSHNMYAGSFQNGMNVIAAGNNGVYMWDGYTLKQFNKTTGALIASNIVLPPVITTGGIGTSAKTFWCGIDVDACEKIYVGYQTTIKVFNSALVQTSVITLPSNLDTVNDVAIGFKGKTLYACGEKFVTSINVAGQATDSVAKATTQATCSCNGTATASLFVQCGNPAVAGVTYLWDNGQTTQTATGLCAGVHNVTLTYNCKPYPDTVTITSPSGLAITQAQTNVKCYGGSTGSSTVNVSGGTAPYVYNWSPAVGTGATAGNLIAGAYTVTATDANNCKITSIVSITEPNPSIANLSLIDNSCTTTGTASVSTGTVTPYTFNWSNGAVGQTAFGLLAGNYTVTVTAGDGCIQSKPFTITGVNPVTATFTQSPNTAICVGGTVNFTNTGTASGTHLWTTTANTAVSGTAANFSFTYLTAGTYSVTHTVTSGGCNGTVTSTVIVNNCSATPTVTAAATTICPGACSTVTSSPQGGTAPLCV
jgi:hypothetical protein